MLGDGAAHRAAHCGAIRIFLSLKRHQKLPNKCCGSATAMLAGMALDVTASVDALGGYSIA